MLRLTARIAGAQSQKDIFTGLAFGMMDQCFGFTSVEVRLAADDRSAVQAGNVTPFAARLETPFTAEGGLSGTITVERAPGERFDDVDRELLAAAASHVAAAVARSAFLDSEKRRSQEQHALRDMLADLSGHLELSQLLQAALQHAVTLLGVTGGELAILDEQTNEMVIVASLNLGTDSTGLRMRIGEGAMGLVRQTHEPLIIPDYQAWTGKSGQYDQSRVHGVMVAPLLIGDRLIGAIASVHSDPDCTFGPEDLRLLEMFTPHAAIAIENARLFTEARRSSEEQTVLLETLSAFSGELELAKVLDAVLHGAVALLGVTGGELAIYEEDTGELVIVASHNLGSGSLGTRMESGEGAMGRVAKTRVPLIIPHHQEWAGRSRNDTVANYQSVLAAPLLIGTRLVGVIAAVHSDPRHAFGEESLRLMSLFGSQAAVAIENARLFTSQKKRAEEQQALLDTLSDLSGELELSKVLKAVLNRAIKLLGVTGGELATFDQGKKELRIAASLNMGIDSVGTRMRLGEGAMGYVAQTQESLTIPNYAEWSGRSAKYELATVHSVMAAPLLIGNRLVGVIAIVDSDPARALGDQDLRLLQLFAPQAAIAIENARVYEAAQQQFEASVLSELLAARSAAEVASGSKSQFLANISHELRAPVDGILGYTERVKDQAEREGRTGYVPDLLKIRSAGRDLLSLIDDVLDLSRIEAGKVELLLEEFPVRDMVRDVTATVQPLIVKNGNRLLTQFDNAVRMARADLTRMRQVLFHLLSSASKLIERGDIRLAIRLDGNDVIYEVSVSGAGMTAEQSANLFDPFAPADSSTGKPSGGAGLGLAISRQFCRLMGGDITVTSEPGKGSTFTARVPVRVEDAVASGQVSVPEPIGTERAAGGLVPVIDDDAASSDPVQRRPDELRGELGLPESQRAD